MRRVGSCHYRIGIVVDRDRRSRIEIRNNDHGIPCRVAVRVVRRSAYPEHAHSSPPVHAAIHGIRSERADRQRISGNVSQDRAQRRTVEKGFLQMFRKLVEHRLRVLVDGVEQRRTGRGVQHVVHQQCN